MGPGLRVTLKMMLATNARGMISDTVLTSPITQSLQTKTASLIHSTTMGLTFSRSVQESDHSQTLRQPWTGSSLCKVSVKIQALSILPWRSLSWLMMKCLQLVIGVAHISATAIQLSMMQETWTWSMPALTKSSSRVMESKAMRLIATTLCLRWQHKTKPALPSTTLQWAKLTWRSVFQLVCLGSLHQTTKDWLVCNYKCIIRPSQRLQNRCRLRSMSWVAMWLLKEWQLKSFSE